MQLSFLRFALLADAAASGATGLLAFAGAGILSGLLGLPTQLLVYAGFSLLPYAAIVAYAGTRPTVSRPAVWRSSPTTRCGRSTASCCWSAAMLHRRRSAMPS
jgi:hypothetical protein